MEDGGNDGDKNSRCSGLVGLGDEEEEVEDTTGADGATTTCTHGQRSGTTADE